MEPASLSAIGSTGGQWGGPWPYWRVEVDAKPSTFWPTDDVSTHYENVSGEEKDGADLICQAEALLNKDASHEQALELAEKALAFFKELKSARGTADAVRVAVHAHRARCQSTIYVKSFGYKHKIRDALRNGQLLAESELEVFRGAGDKRGEAAMELSLAEIAFEGDKKQEALERAKKAVELFHQASDWKMEAIALLALSNMHFRGSNAEDALTCAEKAAGVFKQLGDDRGLSKALHASAVAHALSFDLRAAVRRANEAVSIFRDLQISSKFEAMELLTIAKWQLASEKGREALPAAKEALALFEENAIASSRDDGAQEAYCGKGWLASACRAVVEAYLARDETGNALRAASGVLERCQAEGRSKDVRTTTLIQDALARVHLARDEVVQAVQMCDASWAGAQDDARDQEVAALVLQTWAKVSFRLSGDILEAVSSYHMAGSAAEEAQNLSIQASCYHELFEDCMAARDPKRAQEAAGLYKAACDKQRWGLGAAAGKLLFARVFCLTSQWDKAQDEVGSVPFGDNMSASWKGTVWRHRAEVFEGREEFQNALEAFRNARACFQEAELMKSFAFVILSEANLLHSHQKDSAEAFVAASKAQEQFRKAVDPLGELRALLLLFQAAIQVCADSGGPNSAVIEQAWKLLKDAGRLSKKFGDRASDGAIAYYHAQLALVRGRGNATEALSMASEALSIFVELDDLASQGYVKLFIAQIYSLQGSEKIRKAIDLAKEAMELFMQCGSEDGYAQAMDDMQNMGVNFATLGFNAGMMPMMPMMMGSPTPGPTSLPIASASPDPAPRQDVGSAVAKKLTRTDVSTRVRAIMAEAVNDGDELLGDTSFLDAGVDSLNSVNVRNGLAMDFEIPLAASALFDYPTVNLMTSYIVDQLAQEGKV